MIQEMDGTSSKSKDKIEISVGKAVLMGMRPFMADLAECLSAITSSASFRNHSHSWKPPEMLAESELKVDGGIQVSGSIDKLRAPLIVGQAGTSIRCFPDLEAGRLGMVVEARQGEKVARMIVPNETIALSHGKALQFAAEQLIQRLNADEIAKAGEALRKSIDMHFVNGLRDSASEAGPAVMTAEPEPPLDAWTLLEI